MLGGAYGSCVSLVAAAVASDRPAILLVRDVAEAEGVCDDLKHLRPEVAVILLHPASGDDDLSEPETRVDLSERLLQLRALDELDSGGEAIVVAPIAVMLEALPSSKEVLDRTIDFEVGSTCELESFQKIVHDAGFMTVPMVAAPAEVSFRGDIIDLFPMGQDTPIRIELFDDQIESIRRFDLETQLSVESMKRVSVPLVSPADVRGGPTERTFLHQHLPADALVLFAEPTRLVDRVEEIAAAVSSDRGAVKIARDFLTGHPGVDLIGPRADGVGVHTHQLPGRVVGEVLYEARERVTRRLA